MLVVSPFLVEGGVVARLANPGSIGHAGGASTQSGQGLAARSRLSECLKCWLAIVACQLSWQGLLNNAVCLIDAVWLINAGSLIPADPRLLPTLSFACCATPLHTHGTPPPTPTHPPIHRPRQVVSVSGSEAGQMMKEGWTLLDVRPPGEANKVPIVGSVQVGAPVRAHGGVGGWVGVRSEKGGGENGRGWKGEREGGQNGGGGESRRGRVRREETVGGRGEG
eukprot:357659-Chlamydomonas_euryale.AAC.2